ncbi:MULTISPECIES: adenylate kinase [Pedobacter]|uniref:Adenylate kinase n=1 Tax=Pedobacter heparinus (strain ATCC 13125 / DSM 2366 / CIP 104194 / JCM 7457 / NBRC 12017 / NCIMB 9290 / NRRL B-14731 / HIM 762-3) TaxID=485917 RepID=C6XSL2_PEDHD|nr:MULTISPECIES: adenylate kinase [Pedobacter]ACU05575.1 adenylate kinase [Pedobacter heparinus DSM 2366]MBB5440333.1 adenylate kinase [Pedobacter sp. AK017]
MLNFVLFGPPGAGKGTQSEKLIEKYQLIHISTGDLFRAHIKNQSPLGQRVSALIAEGQLVPDEITIAMLEEEVDKNPGAKGFIFDGFPRTVPQAQALDEFLESKGSSIAGVIALDVDQEELTKRIAQRQLETGRVDDQADKLQKRIEEYFSKTIHVLPYYEAQQKLSKVNGIGKIDDIFADLSAVIDKY